MIDRGYLQVLPAIWLYFDTARRASVVTDGRPVVRPMRAVYWTAIKLKERD